ncbi:uncharacterized protein CC84DRAFT_1168279 [Paraphaeosphaeria sporulosa]|uniref:Uncharacterized protein n=1 Tax=Paraphaeosphaeria sporulosa TaxID=1460663 RepID=A0A177C136_9PLEO|nr:uncharacterized protein CC84DRAFT_1168279 [Paraphaeosphaeria sporulosa]OAG01136.1 hypothetical protein CC84DRAFT_1168279 [Paraphaeosphaeria sporulosa]
MKIECFGLLLLSGIVCDLESVIPSLNGRNMDPSMGQRIAPAVVCILRAVIAFLCGTEGCTPTEAKGLSHVAQVRYTGSHCKARE